jgi:spore maturation protein CgeB
VGWPRNWFDRWISHPGFRSYDIILVPSTTASKYVEENTGIKSFIMPLATNSDRFDSQITPKEEYICDYCFTGSYWNYDREIEQMLDPKGLPYKFKLYGKNWDNSEKFKEYYHGFVNYTNLPEVYASTKLVIDDANNATKQYGSVNSRVYDALAAGAMVITNGKAGAEEIFNGELPVFSSKDELNELINHYLKNEEERIMKIKRLQKIVLENHSYDNRAFELKKILKSHLKTK